MWSCRSEPGGCVRANQTPRHRSQQQKETPTKSQAQAGGEGGRPQEQVVEEAGEEGGKGPLDLGSLETFWSDEKQEADVGTDLLGVRKQRLLGVSQFCLEDWLLMGEGFHQGTIWFCFCFF